MTEQEFEKIIVPLGLLEEKTKEFMKSALIGNFKNWQKKQKELKS